VLAGNTGAREDGGVELGQVQPKGAALFHIHGGKVTRIAVYWSRERALADLGFAPDGDVS
jgi:hypothetical protein